MAIFLDKRLRPLIDEKEAIRWLEENRGEEVLLDRFAEHVTEA